MIALDMKFTTMEQVRYFLRHHKMYKPGKPRINALKAAIGALRTLRNGHSITQQEYMQWHALAARLLREERIAASNPPQLIGPPRPIGPPSIKPYGKSGSETEGRGSSTSSGTTEQEESTSGKKRRKKASRSSSKSRTKKGQRSTTKRKARTSTTSDGSS